MNRFTRAMIIITMIILVGMLGGCTSKIESAENVLKTYYTSIEKGDYKSAYDCLSKDLQKDINYDYFVEYNKLISQTGELKGYSPVQSAETKDVNVDGKLKYKEAVVIPIQEMYVLKGDGSEKKVNITRILALEGEEYKLVWENDVNRFLSNYYADCANKALGAQKPDYDLALANVEAAVARDANNPMAYYYKAIVENRSKKYDSALESIHKCMELNEAELKTIKELSATQINDTIKAKEQGIMQSISYAYNIESTIYGAQGKYEEAIKSLITAIKYYDKNEYANKSIEKLKKQFGVK